MIDCRCEKEFAILKNGEVMNLTIGTDINVALRAAYELYGDSGYAADTWGYRVTFGDVYKDGVFYKPDGSICEHNPSGEERLIDVETICEEMKIFLNELIFPPVKWTINNYRVARIASEVYFGSRSIDEVLDDGRGLREAVQEYLDRWDEL